MGDQLVSSQGVLVPIESISNLNEITTVYNLRVADHHTYFVGGALWGWDVWVHNASCAPKETKTLSQWLKDDPDLLDELRTQYKTKPQWQGIDPDSTPVFYRTKAEVDAIRQMPGESGGHHPHGLALGGPVGQTLTVTNETRKLKNADHSAATALQRKVIYRIKGSKP